MYVVSGVHRTPMAHVRTLEIGLHFNTSYCAEKFSLRLGPPTREISLPKFHRKVGYLGALTLTTALWSRSSIFLLVNTYKYQFTSHQNSQSSGLWGHTLTLGFQASFPWPGGCREAGAWVTVSVTGDGDLGWCTAEPVLGKKTTCLGLPLIAPFFTTMCNKRLWAHISLWSEENGVRESTPSFGIGFGLPLAQTEGHRSHMQSGQSEI